VGELCAPRFVSSLWARSVLAAAPEESRQVGGGMLARLLASGRPEETVAAARLAIRLADLASLGTSLAPAVAHLVESGRYEDAVALWTSACRAGLAGERLYERRTALALLEVSLPYPASCGLLLPAPEEMPKPGDVQECANLLAGWAAWARREHRTAEEALAAPCSERLLEFYRRWLRFRGELVREDTATAQAELQGLFAMEMSEARLVFWRRFGESVLLRNCGRPEEARDISEALMSEQGRLRGAERAQVLHHRASLEFQRGAVEEAVPFLEDAVRLFAALRIRRGGLHAANLLGGVQAQRGDLLRAQASFLELAWRRAQTRDWSAWTTALNNLVLTFVEFGRLGEALQTAAGACSVAERASEPAMLARASQKRIYALLAGGFVRRAHEEGARLLVEGSPTPQTRRLARVCTAEAGILLGETNGARAEFQAVVDDFLAAGSREDAQETLVQWALRESERGDVDRADEVRGAARRISGNVSPLTEGLMALLDADLAASMDAAPDDAAAVALRAVRLLERQNRWYLAWRAHWRLGQALRRGGSQLDAAREYASARTILTGVAESFGREAPVGPFLDLPVVTAFLREMESF